MRTDAKKVVARAKVEGHEEIWKIQCDLFYPPEGPPVAILEWGSDMELLDARFHPLQPELLFESKERQIVDYRNDDYPILIPTNLTNQPKPLTQEAFRRGFFRIE